MDPAIAWLVLGLVLCILEVLLGVGVLFLLFAGLAAIVTAVALYLGLAGGAADYIAQGAWFCGSAAVLTLVLYRPLKRWRTGTGKYRNIAGGKAKTGGEGLTRGREGQVLWSGTTMRAMLDDASPDDHIPADTLVEIVQVQGNMLIVTPVPKE